MRLHPGQVLAVFMVGFLAGSLISDEEAVRWIVGLGAMAVATLAFALWSRHGTTPGEIAALAAIWFVALLIGAVRLVIPEQAERGPDVVVLGFFAAGYLVFAGLRRVLTARAAA